MYSISYKLSEKDNVFKNIFFLYFYYIIEMSFFNPEDKLCERMGDYSQFDNKNEIKKTEETKKIENFLIEIIDNKIDTFKEDIKKKEGFIKELKNNKDQIKIIINNIKKY